MHCVLQNPFLNDMPTLLWRGDFPVSLLTRKRFLVFRNIEYIISDWSGDGFPSIIYLTVEGLDGYLDKNLVHTSRIAAL